MKKPQITARAKADLAEVWTYFAQAGQTSADQFIEKLLKQFHQLAELPRMGRAREDLAPNLRSFPVKKYVIFYRPVDDTVEIVPILHGSRDIGAVFHESATDD